MEIKDKILEEYKKGNVVFATIEGLRVASMEDFIKQPTAGILYDLNRDEATVLTWISENDPKWFNDLAVGQVIRALKDKIEKLENGN